jgi:hypothetical protein
MPSRLPRQHGGDLVTASVVGVWQSEYSSWLPGPQETVHVGLCIERLGDTHLKMVVLEGADHKCQLNSNPYYECFSLCW